MSSQLGLSGSFWTGLENVDINSLGLVTVVMFVVTWVIALLTWRLGRIEERWSAHLQDPRSHETPTASSEAGADAPQRCKGSSHEFRRCASSGRGNGRAR